ncbi:PilZ domain-containing protein [Caminibacter pacificus]
MSKNRFYKENFSAFIKENEKFFKTVESKFTHNFLELLKKKNPNIPITSQLKNEIENLYKSLFLEDYSSQNFKLNAIFILKERNVDIEDILNKVFLLLANAFIKYTLKEKNAIAKLKKLTSLFEFYIEYLIFHVNEEEFFTYHLPKELKEYYLTNEVLNLFNVYKGVPITHKTTILTLNEDRGYIEVEANSYQIIAAKFQKEIYLLEPTTNTTFKAYIDYVYPQRKVLKLTNIEKIQRNTPKRNYIRVQPSTDINVKIKKHKDIFTTKMYDISLKGMAVISDEKTVDIGDFVKLEFILEGYFFEMTAEVRSITKLNDSFRFHFYFEPTPSQERILEKYITKREKEIIKELHKYLKAEFIDV